jgi:Tfp pilus assembly protein PilP
MSTLWTVAGHPVPDPGTWPAYLRAGAALVLGCLVGSAALAIGWALKGWFAAPAVAPVPAKPMMAVTVHGADQPAGARVLHTPHPQAAEDLWRLPVDMGLYPGLSLEWFRPLVPSSSREQGLSGGVALRVRGAYRHLAAWLDELPASLSVRSLKFSTVAAVAGEAPLSDGAEPSLAMEATLDAGPEPPARAAPVWASVAPPHANAKDPFAAPLKVWQGTAADTTDATRLMPLPDAHQAVLERHALHQMALVGVLGREGHTWALLQVDGRLHAAQAGQRLGPHGATVEHIDEDRLLARERTAQGRGAQPLVWHTLGLKEAGP